MSIPSWNDMTLYHYLAIGGGAMVVLALLLYLTPLSRLKVPGVLLGIIGGLAAGTGLGVMGMTYFGYQIDKRGETENAPPEGSGGRANARGPGGQGGSQGGGQGGQRGGGSQGGGGGGGRGGPGGGRPQSVKPQLENLIGKLDRLTYSPIALTLDAEQKKKMREILDKLDEKKGLSEDEAKKKIEDLKKVFTAEQLKSLEETGYRWPGQGGGFRPPVSPEAVSNPFADGDNNERLKSLLGRLDAK